MEAIRSNVIPFPVKRKETVEETTREIVKEINPLQLLRQNWELEHNEIYFPIPVVEFKTEEIVPEKKFPNYDFNVKGRTALDLTGMKFVKENLERKAAIKRAHEYVCSNAKRNELKLLNKVKLYIDKR